MVAAPNGSVLGEQKQWHKTTLAFDGPQLREAPATFTDYRLDVTFRHESGAEIVVPGFFAADGNAAETGATAGTTWLVHFNPTLSGEWAYTADFKTGENVAADRTLSGTSLAFDGANGGFTVAPSDKGGDDFRGKGILANADGDHYLTFQGTGETWIKTGVDSPENFLAYEDFDGTPATVDGRDLNLKTYADHRGDWNDGDPTWQGGEGKAIVGAINYLAENGVNSVYFLTNNAGGDGRDTFPWVNPKFASIPRSLGDGKTMADAVKQVDGLEYADFVTFDVSKLAQWDVVFGHMQQKGVNLHVVLQETENDQLLDGGALGTVGGEGLISVERAVYMRELVARFGYHNALTWNLGEENTNSKAQQAAFFDLIKELDPYDHYAAVHTYPNRQDSIYDALLGNPDVDGASVQTRAFAATHDAIEKWVNESAQAGEPWVVMADETADSKYGALPDADAPGHNEARSEGLWGALMAGGGGIEWYSGRNGYDQKGNEFYARADLYRQAKIAREFFEEHLPYSEMKGADGLLQLADGGEGYVFAKPNEVYLVYTEDGDRDVVLDLSGVSGTFVAYWWDPYEGGLFQLGSVESVTGGGLVNFGAPPSGVTDNRPTDKALNFMSNDNRELRVEDAVLLVKRADVDLNITADDVAGGRLAQGDLVSGGNVDDQPPAVSPQTVTIEEDAGPNAVAVSADEFGDDPDGDGIYFRDVTGAENGEVTLAGEASTLFYTPDDDFFGTETLQVSLWDQNNAAAVSSTTLTITVTPVNDPPVAADDVLNFDYADASLDDTSGLATLTFVENRVLGNDGDVDGTGGLDWFISGDAQSGTLSRSSEGTVADYTFDPLAHPGQDSFAYYVVDEEGAQSGAATVTLNIANLPSPDGPSPSNPSPDGNPAPAELLFAYNIGSNNAYTAADGTVFAADTISDGRRYKKGGEVAGTEDDTLYVTEAWTKGSTLDYAFDLPNGDYTVRLHFAEIWSGAQKDGGRVFDVAVEEAVVTDDLDIFAEVGARTALIKEFNATVTDGTLNVDLLSQVQNPKLSAIEVYATQVGDSAPTNSPPAPENTPPTAVDDAFSFDFAQDVYVDPNSGVAEVSFDKWQLFANDLDAGRGDEAYVDWNWEVVAPPSDGDLQLAGEASIITYRFDPANHPGGDSFSYRATDEDGADSNVATVTLNFANLPPDDAAGYTLSLVDAAAERVLFELGESTVVDADSVAGLDVTVAAVAGPELPGVTSAKLFLDGSRTSTENVAPYTLFGDWSGNYYSGGLTLADGDARTFAVKFYDRDGGKGALLATGESVLAVDDGIIDLGSLGAPDVYAFDETKMGADTVRSFDELDTLAFFGDSGLSAADVLDRATVLGEDTVIALDAQNVLTLDGYTGLSLDNIVV